jgi:hypothetical protein
MATIPIVDCIWLTPCGDCGPARVPAGDRLVPCTPEKCTVGREPRIKAAGADEKK